MPADVVNRLKALARRHGCSMEQEVRDILADHTAERESILDRIEASWPKQARRPTAAEVDAWINAGRS
ncbi:MAG: hypothetical protein R2762_16575 [Bryobacteraceae bacterium]